MQLRSPRLKLNFRRFSGLLVSVYNQAVDNKYSWFLRTSDFEETRLQYEFDFECEASRWHTIRMPFNAFRLVRADGVPVPEDEASEFTLNREDVIQMGIAVRTGDQPRPYGPGDALNYFSLALKYIKVFRTQPEPQVVYLGRDGASMAMRGSTSAEEEDGEEEEEDEMVFTGEMDLDEELAKVREAEAKAAAEIEELVSADLPEVRAGSGSDVMLFQDGGQLKTPVQAVVESGLAFTIIKVNALNEHPGGKFPISVQQASIREPPMSTDHHKVLGSISRGDAAELVVSALTEPSCVNAEVAAGESASRYARPAAETGQSADLLTPSFEIGSTLEEDVKAYLKQLVPNR